jgi:glutamyl-tRNA synthetase
MILGADKTRLSKRHGATSVMAYRDLGLLPEAMINYLVRLGWSHGDQEIFSIEELIEKFDVGDVGKSAGVFNPDKLLWLNAHYIKTGDPRRLAGLLLPFLRELGVETDGGPDLAAVVRTLQERARTMLEMADGAVFYYKGDFAYDAQAAEKFLKPDVLPVYETVLNKLEQLTEFTHSGIEEMFKAICTELGVKLGQVGPPVRVALCGGTTSPGIYEVIEVLGREESARRLRRAMEQVKKL